MVFYKMYQKVLRRLKSEGFVHICTIQIVHIWTISKRRKTYSKSCINHNHKRSSCHVDFNPNVLKKELPNANTMICEQTLSWLGRFKKILNSLPKHRFDFMLHRLIIHRNRYTEYCHSVNKYPLLPSVKPTKKT